MRTPDGRRSVSRPLGFVFPAIKPFGRDCAKAFTRRARKDTAAVRIAEVAQRKPRQPVSTWTHEDDERLVAVLNSCNNAPWHVVAEKFGSLSGKKCRDRYHSVLKTQDQWILELRDDVIAYRNTRLGKRKRRTHKRANGHEEEFDASVEHPPAVTTTHDGSAQKSITEAELDSLCDSAFQEPIDRFDFNSLLDLGPMMHISQPVRAEPHSPSRMAALPTWDEAPADPEAAVVLKKNDAGPDLTKGPGLHTSVVCDRVYTRPDARHSFKVALFSTCNGSGAVSDWPQPGMFAAVNRMINSQPSRPRRPPHRAAPARAPVPTRAVLAGLVFNPDMVRMG